MAEVVIETGGHAVLCVVVLRDGIVAVQVDPALHIMTISGGQLEGISVLLVDSIDIKVVQPNGHRRVGDGGWARARLSTGPFKLGVCKAVT